MADKAKKRSKFEQTYQHKAGICITLYDATGGPINPVAQEEFEEAALHIAQQHPNHLLSIAVE